MNEVTTIPRPEHPRPDFMRDTFFNLNGDWQFEFDDANEGLEEKWYIPGHVFAKTIIVPFCYQSLASGIGPTDEIHPVLWYRRTFSVPMNQHGKRIHLCFGAVDYSCRIYINGELIGNHEGGYTPFSFDITDLLNDGSNDLCLRVEDKPDCSQPRGKQYWKQGLMGCWYTPVSGIWQTVYLEATEDNYLRFVHITPDVDHQSCIVNLHTAYAEPLICELNFSCEGEKWKTVTVSQETSYTEIPVNMVKESTLDPVRLWSPQKPVLYDVNVRLLRNDKEIDHVRTYFGMRKIELKEGMIYLNNSPLYQRLVLDQGYWPDTLLTAPSDEALQTDIRMTMAFGYNGARKHQKVEEPRYYYHADRMGLLVWGEIPSPYEFTPTSVRGISDTLDGFIERDFNHPCIITWVPINESWGFPHIRVDERQQAAARMLYQLTKAQDHTRLCSGNDGWEQVQTDICALHDYADNSNAIEKHFASREQVETHTCDWRDCYAQGATRTGNEAFMVTEYGGIAFVNLGLQGELGGMETWGYHDKVQDEEAFFERFSDVHNAILNIPYNQGYCYTQLTDVMQEVNGLMTPDRKPKVNIDRFSSINSKMPGRSNNSVTF